VSHGFGFLESQGKMIIAITQLWAASVLFTKLTIIILLDELFSTAHYLKIATRVLGVVAIMLWMTQLIGGLGICVPIESWWSIAAVTGWCGARQRVLFVSTSVVHTITDFAILLLPAPCLWSLKLPTKTRIGLILVFSGGLVATVISVGRIITLARLDWSDVTYSEWEALLFSVVEPSLGIWIACVPHIRSLFNSKAARVESVHVKAGYMLESTTRKASGSTVAASGGEVVSPTTVV